MASDDDRAGGPLQLERVYYEIKQRIVHGRYPPGMTMSESRLARVHRASRTPVREALSRLLEERYVDRVARKGYTVAPITIAAIRHTFEIRRLLESAAAAQAAASATAEAVAKMRRFADYPVLEATADSYRARLDVNLQFHVAVALATENGLLVDLIRHCLTQHNRVLSLGLEFPVQARSVAQHQAIVAAIERHDSRGASQAMGHHLDEAHRLVMDALEGGRIRGVGPAHGGSSESTLPLRAE